MLRAVSGAYLYVVVDDVDGSELALAGGFGLGEDGGWSCELRIQESNGVRRGLCIRS
jgi:hypothetical protein